MVWSAAEILSLEPNGDPRVHYVGWDDRWDAVVPITRINLPVTGRKKQNQLPYIPPRPQGNDVRMKLRFSEHEIDAYAIATSDGHRFTVGDIVFVQEGRDWSLAEVLAVEGAAQVKVHYIGWDDKFDGSVPLTRTKLPKK
jgi:hypothetical protein